MKVGSKISKNFIFFQKFFHNPFWKWQTWGSSEKQKPIPAEYYRNSDGIFIVFDVSKPQSFDNVKSWTAPAGECDKKQKKNERRRSRRRTNTSQNTIGRVHKTKKPILAERCSFVFTEDFNFSSNNSFLNWNFLHIHRAKVSQIHSSPPLELISKLSQLNIIRKCTSCKWFDFSLKLFNDHLISSKKKKVGHLLPRTFQFHHIILLPRRCWCVHLLWSKRHTWFSGRSKRLEN